MKRSKFWQSCAIVLLTVLTLATAACGQSPAERMQKAQQYESQGAYRKAMIELKNVLKKQPDNAKARFLLGKVSLQRGDPTDAENQLGRAQKLGVDAEEVQPLLANALLAQHKFNDVLKRIDIGSSEKKSVQAELLAARGQAHLALGHNDEAAAAFSKAIKTYPRTAQALIGEAQLALVHNDIKTAGGKLDDALKVNPKAMRAWLIKGNIAAHERQFPQAVEDFRKAIDAPEEEVTPAEKFTTRGRLATVLMQQGKDKEARTQIDNMLKQAPKHPLPNYLRAVLAYQEKNYDLAVDKLQKVLSVVPGSARAQELLGTIKAQQGDMAQAQMYLTNALSKNPKNPQRVIMLARVLMRQGDTDRAVEVLNDAVKRGVKDPRILAMLNNAIMASGRTAAGRNYLQQNLAAQTHDPNVQMSLAKAFLQAGQNDEAMTLLQQINGGDESADFQRQVLVVMTLLRKGEKSKALAEAQSLSQSEPDNPAGHNLLGGVYIALDRPHDARAQFEQALKLAPGDDVATLNLGLLSMRTGQYRKAVDDLQPLARKNNLRAMMLLARAYTGLGKTDKAIGTVREASKAHPDALEPRLVLIRYYVESNQPDKAQKLAQEAVQRGPDNAGLINLLGLTQLAGEHAKDAMASFSKAVDKAPEVPAFQFNLARAQIAADQLPDAIKTLQGLRENHADYRPAFSLLAFAQMKNNQPEAAFATADALKKQVNHNGDGELLEGLLHENRHDYAAAAKAFDQAVKAGDRRAVGYAVAAHEKAHLNPTEQPFLDWLSSHENDSKVRSGLAQWYVDHGNYAKAAAQYRTLLAGSNGNDPGLLNNLAWAYFKQSDRRALKTARKAYRLAPGNAAVADTLGWIQVHQGDLGAGVKHLKQAADGNPGSSEIAYHLAYALAKSGDKAQALTTVTQALKRESDFDDRAAAEKLEQQLKE